MNSFEGLGENAKSIKNETSPPCFYNLTFEFTDLSFIITAYKGENCSETKVITHEIERENNLIKFKDTFNPNKTNVMEIEYADESKATFIVIEEGIAVMKFHLLKQEN